mgnify:FL=1
MLGSNQPHRHTAVSTTHDHLQVQLAAPESSAHFAQVASRQLHRPRSCRHIVRDNAHDLAALEAADEEAAVLVDGFESPQRPIPKIHQYKPVFDPRSHGFDGLGVVLCALAKAQIHRAAVDDVVEDAEFERSTAFPCRLPKRAKLRTQRNDGRVDGHGIAEPFGVASARFGDVLCSVVDDTPATALQKLSASRFGQLLTPSRIRQLNPATTGVETVKAGQDGTSLSSPAKEQDPQQRCPVEALLALDEAAVAQVSVDGVVVEEVLDETHDGGRLCFTHGSVSSLDSLKLTKQARYDSCVFSIC